jgi:3-oxoacyl-(acyl-carrier-protein) synthase
LTGIRVFVTGIGIISPAGKGFPETINAVKHPESYIKPITLFPAPNAQLPVGEISLSETYTTPRTHKLALIAAKEAVKNELNPPDAIVLGTTTGGIDLTENLIKNKFFNPEFYRYHSTGTVAEYIAQELNCRGIILTITTACSSGTLALKLGLELLRHGMAKSVLAGGADALSRLTYHGFNSLQLLDPDRAKPFDKNRKGMSIAEGAAMLLLKADANPPETAMAEILGAGASCDAYHPASPHPEGAGAIEAIKAALKDAGISHDMIDYINLHGTGTIDNDLSEAKALHAIFGNKKPYLSSTKGMYGHPLAAAGTIEAAISVISIKEGIIPESTGFKIPDPELDIIPSALTMTTVNTVLSNSFGFGGNNASVIFSNPEKHSNPVILKKLKPLAVLGCACITGAGNTEDTNKALKSTGKCSGTVDIDRVSQIKDRKKLRRLKRLSKMALSLAAHVRNDAVNSINPKSVFFGTGFGALSETYDFLEKLFESGEKFPSPTDFIGSVHNAPAGQVAMELKATGANVTSTGGDYSFEQALLCASLFSGEDNDPVIVIGADEYHDKLSKALDSSLLAEMVPSDGGGAILLRQSDNPGLSIYSSFFEYAHDNDDIINNFIQKSGGADRISNEFGAIFVGIPADKRSVADEQLRKIQSAISADIPVIDYRKFTGNFASASAAAAAIAINCVKSAFIPPLAGNDEIILKNKGILMIGLGNFVTAIEIRNT